MSKPKRRLCFYRFAKWLDGCGLVRAARAALRAIFDLIDHTTGATNLRHPMTIERIAARSGFSSRTVTRVLVELEVSPFVTVFRDEPRRMPDGTFRQAPNLYRLNLPDECWVEVREAAQTVAAKPAEPEPSPGPRRVLRAISSALANTFTVRGSLSTKDAAPIVRERPGRDEEPELIGLDGIQVEDLAGRMILTAQLAAADCPEERRFVAVVGIERLQERAYALATETTRMGLCMNDVLGCVRHWVKKTLTNDEQWVKSAEHAVNILRRFIQSRADWEERKADVAFQW